jgi:hypothetical protein
VSRVISNREDQQAASLRSSPGWIDVLDPNAAMLRRTISTGRDLHRPYV